MEIILDAKRNLVDKAADEIRSKVLMQSGAYITDENGGKVAFLMETPALSEAYKRRIVAAVNACAGMSLEDMRAMGVGGLSTLLERARGGARSEGAEAVSVEVQPQDQGEPLAESKNTVFVVAWQYTGGAGFNWYRTEDEALEAFKAERANCQELRDSLWTAYHFEFELPQPLLAEEITQLIDSQLDDLCARSGNRYAYGDGMQMLHSTA